MLLSIIEDNLDYLVVDKPAGLSFHCQPQSLGLQVQLEQQVKQKLWPVHRLDKITSGLVIFAKSAQNAAEFGNLFEQRQIRKCYIALSDKKPKKKMGKVSGDMVKSRSGSWKLTHTRSNPAISKFQSQGLTPGIRLFLVKPTTGKTHQIRVALKSLGSPILGDTRYGGSQADRGYLHHYSIEFLWKNKLTKIQVLPNQGRHFNQISAFELANKLATLTS